MKRANVQRAESWRLRTRTLHFGRLPLLMGIINVTPDSFSDGGRCFDADAAVAHGLRLAAEGADILDIGGESTRPFSKPVEPQEELRRVLPVVDALVKRTGAPISIDTRKALVARHAIRVGAEIINDITALAGDPGMLPLAVESGAGVCVMHMQGEPQTMQAAPQYDNVVADVMRYLAGRRDALVAAGIAQDRIALDPGIGFGKTAEHNLQLLADARRLHELGCPVLVGHSRKRFLEYREPEDCRRCRGNEDGTVPLNATNSSASGEATYHSAGAASELPPTLVLSDRTGGTIGVALSLARQGVQVLRVHDVAAVRQALAFFQLTGGLD